jgi:hypothetical protein
MWAAVDADGSVGYRVTLRHSNSSAKTVMWWYRTAVMREIKTY